MARLKRGYISRRGCRHSTAMWTDLMDSSFCGYGLD